MVGLLFRNPNFTLPAIPNGEKIGSREKYQMAVISSDGW